MLNLSSLFKVGAPQCNSALLQELEHLCIVEAKLDVSDIGRFFFEPALLDKLLLYALAEVLFKNLDDSIFLS